MGKICQAAGRVGLTLRQLVCEDRAVVRELLVDSRAFSDEEVRVAMEMVESGLQGDYFLPAVEYDGKVRGYACIGRAPLTETTWYLYWICVHPSKQRVGIGRELQRYVERLALKSGCDRLVVETSGRPDYERARRFYQQAGFTEVGRIPGFYKPADDCVILFKIIGGGQNELPNFESREGDF